MALALDPFDIDFISSPSRASAHSDEPGRRPMALPPIALCLPTLFGPVTFPHSPSGPNAPSGEEVEVR